MLTSVDQRHGATRISRNGPKHGTDFRIMLKGAWWSFALADGPLLYRGHRHCVIVSNADHTITIDRETPPNLMPRAVAKAIEIVHNREPRV